MANFQINEIIYCYNLPYLYLGKNVCSNMNLVNIEHKGKVIIVESKR